MSDDLFDTVFDTVSLRLQIEAARREVRLRETVYPRWVEQGKMKPDKAVHEIAAMRAIVATLLDLAEGEKQVLASMRALTHGA